MNRLTESAIENFAIRLFEHFDYDYIHASDIATVTTVSTHKKCSAIQVASVHKPVTLSP